MLKCLKTSMKCQNYVKLSKNIGECKIFKTGKIIEFKKISKSLEMWKLCENVKKNLKMKEFQKCRI